MGTGLLGCKWPLPNMRSSVADNLCKGVRHNLPTLSQTNLPRYADTEKRRSQHASNSVSKLGSTTAIPISQVRGTFDLRDNFAWRIVAMRARCLFMLCFAFGPGPQVPRPRAARPREGQATRGWAFGPGPRPMPPEEPLLQTPVWALSFDSACPGRPWPLERRRLLQVFNLSRTSHVAQPQFPGVLSVTSRTAPDTAGRLSTSSILSLNDSPTHPKWGFTTSYAAHPSRTTWTCMENAERLQWPHFKRCEHSRGRQGRPLQWLHCFGG